MDNGTRIGIVKASEDSIPDVSEDQQDYSLVKRCQSGDSEAMAEIVHRYQTQVYNIAYGLLRHSEDAKDITQDVFLRVWEKVGQFQFKSRFSTWLYRIAINLCKDELYRRRRRQVFPLEMNNSQVQPSLDPVTPEEVALLAERQRMLRDAQARLKPKYRELLVLREVEDLPYDEIAEVLGWSEAQVKSRLHEARKHLRKILEKLDY